MMKFMVTFTLSADAQKRADAIGRFQSIGQRAPAGAKLLSRLTRADLSGGFVLLETDDPRSIGEFAYTWSDLMEVAVVPVVDDEGLASSITRGEAVLAEVR